jgi:hypothetical protein
MIGDCRMNVVLKSIRKSAAGTPRSPVYTTTFLIDGKVRRFHAVVSTRQGSAIRFQESGIDRLLAENMDQGRSVYQAVSQTHRGLSPKLPMALGRLPSATRHAQREALALSA